MVTNYFTGSPRAPTDTSRRSCFVHSTGWRMPSPLCRQFRFSEQLSLVLFTVSHCFLLQCRVGVTSSLQRRRSRRHAVYRPLLLLPWRLWRPGATLVCVMTDRGDGYKLVKHESFDVGDLSRGWRRDGCVVAVGTQLQCEWSHQMRGGRGLRAEGGVLLSNPSFPGQWRCGGRHHGALPLSVRNGRPN